MSCEALPHPIPLSVDIADRLLISRLELDPHSMTYAFLFMGVAHNVSLTPIYSDDLDFLPVLASLPPQQTVFEYLVKCWRRLNSARSALLKKVCLDRDLSLIPQHSMTHSVVAGISPDGDPAGGGQAREAAASNYQLYRFDAAGTGDVPSTRWVSRRSHQT